MPKFHFKDWAGNVLFNGKTFKTFEDAWDFYHETFPNAQEEDLNDIFVVPLEPEPKPRGC